MSPSLLSLSLLLAAIAVVPRTHGASLSIENSKLFDISPLLQSAFFESEINYGSEGGLYAELIANRDFETQGRGVIPGHPQQALRRSGTTSTNTNTTTNGEAAELHAGSPQYHAAGLDPKEPPAVPTDVRPWEAVNGAEIAADSSTHPFSSNPVSLRVTTVCEAPPCYTGVRNPGYWGINARANEDYNLQFYARCADSTPIDLYARLIGSDGKQVLDVVPITIKGGWAKYSAKLTSADSDDGAWFELVTNARASFWLDSVSLFPKDAVAGLFRSDLFTMLANLRPGFIRVPGGNYLEGTGPRTRWNWKATLGLPEARSGHYNSAWGYWVTDGMGIYELLVLAEAAKSQAQMGIYTGYSMGQPYVPLNESAVFVQDALDLLEFANGPSSSTYGKMRADAGHAAPFNLTRLEIGNEERLMAPNDYPGHYRIITQAIWAKYPEIVVVASGRWGPDITGSPCLTGQRCDAWDDHYYRTPDQMAALGEQYDNYNRSWPDVFVGEYAANNGHQQTLQAGLAESIFLLGMEANGDKVVASSFAPLFCNIPGTQWGYDLINFNSSKLYALPSYSMQKMLRDNLNNYLLSSSLSDVQAITKATAGVQGSNVIIKITNYGADAQILSVALAGFSHVGSTGNYTLLTSYQGPNAENSLDQPNNVAPVHGTLPTGAAFRIALPPWSFQVVSVSAA